MTLYKGGQTGGVPSLENKELLQHETKRYQMYSNGQLQTG
jgi:hypothetical protein